MNIYQYVETSKDRKKSISYEIDRNFLKSYSITFHRNQIGNRYINYYIKRNTGISKMLGEETTVYIFLNKQVSDLIRVINSQLFDLKDLTNALKQYKYLIDCSCLKGSAILLLDNYKPLRDYSFGDQTFFWGGVNIEGRIAIQLVYFGCVSEDIILKNLRTMIGYADNVTKEALQIRINFSKIKRRETDGGFIETLPPYLRKTVVYGGVFLLKVAARSLGSDIDANVDIDVDIPDLPDIDGYDDSNTIDFEFDSDYSDLVDLSAISFGNAPNDGTYMRTNHDVYIQVAGGNDIGSYDVYLHNGDKYIDFHDHWIKIQGKTRFHFNGNDYIIKG